MGPTRSRARLWANAAKELTAQLVANEIGARLGGACLVGPLNGQMWSFIHAAQTAVMAGLLRDFDEHKLANALAISLYQPPRPVASGFFNAETKLLTVADPALAGLRAAKLADAGVEGPATFSKIAAAFCLRSPTRRYVGCSRGWERSGQLGRSR
jgi:2-methylcitrate dehydratase PrpD